MEGVAFTEGAAFTEAAGGTVSPWLHARGSPRAPTPADACNIEDALCWRV